MRNTSPHSRIARLFAAGAAAIALIGSSIASPAPAYAATTTCAQERAAAQKELTAAQNEASKANSALKAAQTEKTAADSALKTAKASETQAKNNLAAAKKKLATAEANFASVKAEKAKIDAAKKVPPTSDVSLTGQIPFYMPVNGNTYKPANSTLVGVEGQFSNTEGTWNQTKILDLINQERDQAYKEGLVTQKPPHLSWSKSLERTAQIRAVESAVLRGHERLTVSSNDDYFWNSLTTEGFGSIAFPSNFSGSGGGENLGWNGYYGTVQQWLGEKETYKKKLNCDAGKKVVNGVNQCVSDIYDRNKWGHYASLVNPVNKFIGIAEFKAAEGTNAKRSSVAGRLSVANPSGSTDVKPSGKKIVQGVYVHTGHLKTVNSSKYTYTRDTYASLLNINTYVTTIANNRWNAIANDYNTKQAAVTAAQKEVNTAQAAVDKITAAQTRASKAATALTNAQARVTKANQAVNTAQAKLAAAQKCLVSGITVSGSTSVNPGKTISLSAQINPTDAKNKAVTWSSSNTKIATVDAKGTVKGIAPGKVTITVTAKDGSKVKGTKTVQVVIPTDDVYRLYNTKSHEHLFTTSPHEKNVLSAMADWNYEGIAWKAPKSSKTPVYRLYNPTSGDHLYTTSSHEVTVLTTKHGWKKEGIAFYSDDYKTIPVYRQYNPALKTGSHHFTANLNEYNVNNTRGWKGEGIAWYAAAK